MGATKGLIYIGFALLLVSLLVQKSCFECSVQFKMTVFLNGKNPSECLFLFDAVSSFSSLDGVFVQ